MDDESKVIDWLASDAGSRALEVVVAMVVVGLAAVVVTAAV